MRRIVLDANVLAPGFTGRASASAQLIDRWRAGVFVLVVSEHVLRELAHTLSDPYFATKLAPLEAAAIVAMVGTEATRTEITVEVRGVATHPEDDAVLATALSGEVTILSTRDRQLLRLHSYQTLAIHSPGELLALLETEAR